MLQTKVPGVGGTVIQSPRSRLHLEPTDLVGEEQRHVAVIGMVAGADLAQRPPTAGCGG